MRGQVERRATPARTSPRRDGIDLSVESARAPRVRDDYFS